MYTIEFHSFILKDILTVSMFVFSVMNKSFYKFAVDFLKCTFIYHMQKYKKLSTAPCDMAKTVVNFVETSHVAF